MYVKLAWRFNDNYGRFNQINNDMKNDAGIKILTDEGWSNFKGIVRQPKEQHLWTIVAEYGGNTTELKATPDQKIYYTKHDCKPLQEYKVGDNIFMNDRIGKVIAIDVNTEVDYVYDVIDVEKGNKFYCNEILVSNCAFVGESNTLIRYETLQELSKRTTGSKPIFEFKGFQFYKEIQAGYKYILGIDTSMGSSGDYCAMQIFQFPGFEQIAEFHNNRINQADQVELTRDVLQYIYSTLINKEKRIPSIFWSVESNSSAAGFLGVLQERGGASLYIPEATFVSEKAPEKLGIALTNKSRPLACSKFKSMLEMGEITINSRELVRELNFFIDDSKNGKTHYAAKPGEHDDLITACFNVLLAYLKVKESIDLDSFMNQTPNRLKRFNFNMPFLHTTY